jgi:hypothetical protein
MYYVIATEDGDAYPSVARIFSSEEKAMEYVKSYVFHTNGSGDQKITHQYDYDKNSRLFMHDPLLLGRAEEGEEISYYRGLSNEYYLSVSMNDMSEEEKNSVRPL